MNKQHFKHLLNKFGDNGFVMGKALPQMANGSRCTAQK